MLGILFKDEMVKAIKEGRKTQTRRLRGLKEINQDLGKWDYQGFDRVLGRAYFYTKAYVQHTEGDPKMRIIKSHYHVGEVVYVKEAWCQVGDGHDNPFVVYKLTTPDQGCKWHSPLFMPAWAARTFIQIEDVRVQRLQEITEEDAIKEGCSKELIPGIELPSAKRRYSNLWDSINKKFPWESNPWLFAYTFHVVPLPEVLK